MNRRHLVLGLTLGVGMLLGAYAVGFLHAQAQIQRTTLVHADMASIAGKEADAWIAEFPPGTDTGKHFHHADHLARSLLTDHLGPAKTVMRRFSPPYLQAFSAQFFRGQDSLGSTITSVEIDAWMVSWQAQQPVRRRHRPSR
jgi:hypothetical protein